METFEVTEKTNIGEMIADDQEKIQLNPFLAYRDYFIYENTKVEIKRFGNDEIYPISMKDIMISDLYSYILYPTKLARELYIQKRINETELKTHIDEETNKTYYTIEFDFETVLKKVHIEDGHMILILREPNIMEFKVIRKTKYEINKEEENPCYNIIYMLNITECTAVKDILENKLTY